MEKAATQAFIVGSEKYTPQSMTFNSIKGKLWTKRVLKDGGWIHQGKQHVRNGAPEIEVMSAFVPEVDLDAVDAYWDSL